MSIEIRWSPSARENLLDIYGFMALNFSSMADDFYLAIEKRVEILKHFPRAGGRRREIGRAVRVLVEGLYLILYETHPDSDRGLIEWVEIVNVVDGRRDVARVL